MKIDSIHAGSIYYDGKLGVREVVSLDGAAGCGDTKVAYRILAAKVENEYSHAKRAMVSLIGSTYKCELASFAAWAKIAVPAGQKAALLADLAAKKVRLAPGEARFMASVGESFDREFPLKAGAAVSFNSRETRTVRGIEKKGLVAVKMGPPGAGGEIALTELGVAWVKSQRSSPVQPSSQDGVRLA